MEAVRGTDIDEFRETVQTGIDKVRAAAANRAAVHANDRAIAKTQPPSPNIQKLATIQTNVRTIGKRHRRFRRFALRVRVLHDKASQLQVPAILEQKRVRRFAFIVRVVIVAVAVEHQMLAVLGANRELLSVIDRVPGDGDAAARIQMQVRFLTADQIAADQLGLYITTAAGYSPQAYADFWDRWHNLKGKTGNWFSDLFSGPKPEQKRLREMVRTVAAMPRECIETRPASTAAFAACWSAAEPVMMNEPAGNVTPSAVNDFSATFIGTFRS